MRPAISSPTPFLAKALILALLVAPVCLSLHSMARKSWTWDEPIYLAGGHYLMRTGNFRNQAISYHPPLAFYWNSLGLAGLEFPRSLFPPVTTDHDWDVGMQVAFRSGHDPGVIKWRARLPFVLLSPVLGMLVYCWSRRLWGWRGALVSLSLVSFDPNLLAHNRFVTTDYIFTVMLVGTLFLGWALLRGGGWGKVCGTAIGLGLTFLAKFTAIILFPVAALGAYWALKRDPPDGWRSWRPRHAIPCGLAMIGVALAVLWAGYLFQFDVALPDPEQRAAVVAMEPLQGIAGVYQRLYRSELRVPAVSYFMGFFSQFSHGSGGHSNYLLGEVRESGWWQYFPIAIAVKTPIPILLAWVAGAVAAIRSRAHTRDVIWLMLAPIVLLALSTRSNINIGVRHVLILYPLMAILAGAAIRWVRTSPSRLALAIGLVWVVVGTLRVHPDYLTYFNEAAGGPARGHRLLVDSNLDWGQDVDALFARAQAEGWTPMQVQYFGPPRRLAFAPPGFHSLAHPCSASSGYIAVSMTNRVGAYMDGGAECFQWLDGVEPLAVIHNSIAIYHIPEVSRAPGPS